MTSQCSVPQIYLPSPHPPSNRSETYLIWFITGNPGLISYYTTFLNTLSFLLAKTQPSARFHIFGSSLDGFEATSLSANKGQCYSLDDVITLTGYRLQGYVRVQNKSEEPIKVILVGHSVGAYIALELIRKWQEGGLGKLDGQRGGGGLRIIGSCLLFPTVTHIAQSPSGKKLTRLLQSQPNLETYASTLTKLLTYLLPSIILTLLLQLLLRFQRPAAQTTVRFLKSPFGVRQALHLSRDEMTSITADKWQATLWSPLTSSNPPPPKLIFHFGHNDHWVANETRDELIAARGYLEKNSSREEEEDGERKMKMTRPKMIIDNQGIPHGFCLREHHSKLMAEKTSGYILEIVDAH